MSIVKSDKTMDCIGMWFVQFLICVTFGRGGAMCYTVVSCLASSVNFEYVLKIITKWWKSQTSKLFN